MYFIIGFIIMIIAAIIYIPVWYKLIIPWCLKDAGDKGEAMMSIGFSLVGGLILCVGLWMLWAPAMIVGGGYIVIRAIVNNKYEGYNDV